MFRVFEGVDLAFVCIINPFIYDTLTSYITANIPRDIDIVRNDDAEYLRIETDG